MNGRGRDDWANRLRGGHYLFGTSDPLYEDARRCYEEARHVSGSHERGWTERPSLIAWDLRPTYALRTDGWSRLLPARRAARKPPVARALRVRIEPPQDPIEVDGVPWAPRFVRGALVFDRDDAETERVASGDPQYGELRRQWDNRWRRWRAR